MNGVRLLAASLAASGAIVLGGCVAVPAGPYYSSGAAVYSPTYAYPYSYYPYYPYYGWPAVSLSASYGYYGHGYYGGYWRPYGYPYWGHGGYYGGYRGGAGWARVGHHG